MVQSKQNDVVNRTENKESSVGANALAEKSLFTRGMEPPGGRFHSSGSDSDEEKCCEGVGAT